MLAKNMTKFISDNSGKILYLLLFLVILYNIFIPANVGHADELGYSMEYHEKAIPQNHLPVVKDIEPIQIFDATLTAYSSTPDQCSGNPFITASGTGVRDGVIACNFLRFGTRVRFPQLYGEKIFVVEDRMAVKNSHKMDIWFVSRDQARQFGIKIAKVEILGT